MSKENFRLKYMDRTKSTKINKDNTPENIFPFSIFNANNNENCENFISNKISYLNKRNEIINNKNYSPSEWIRNSLKKSHKRLKNLKKIKASKLF